MEVKRQVIWLREGDNRSRFFPVMSNVGTGQVKTFHFSGRGGEGGIEDRYGIHMAVVDIYKRVYSSNV